MLPKSFCQKKSRDVFTFAIVCQECIQTVKFCHFKSPFHVSKGSLFHAIYILYIFFLQVKRNTYLNTYFFQFSSIYVGPEGSEVPLIVWPHGGPHSAIPWAFLNDIYYFLDQGFACLLINYRGSISQGQSGIMSLLGKGTVI